MRTPQRGRRLALRRSKRPHSDTEAESDKDELGATREASKVHLALEIELKAITPPLMEPGEESNIFFKPPGSIQLLNSGQIRRQRGSGGLSGGSRTRSSEAEGDSWLREDQRS